MKNKINRYSYKKKPYSKRYKNIRNKLTIK